MAPTGSPNESSGCAHLAVNGLVRVVMFFTGLLLGIFALAMFTSSRVIIEFPAMDFGVIALPGAEHLDPRNGLCLTLCVMSLLAAALAFNRAFRSSDGTGICDRALTGLCGPEEQDPAGLWGLVAFLGLIATLAYSVYLILGVYRFHFDPELAARAFSRLSEDEVVINTNRLAFANDENGRVNVALLTPSLIRAARRFDIRIGGVGFVEREVAIPGAVPLFVLSAIILIGASARFFASSQESLRHRLTAIASITGMYVVLWLIAGQFGNELQIFGRPPDLVAVKTGDAQRHASLVSPAYADWLVLHFYVRSFEWTYWSALLVAVTITSTGALILKLGNARLPTSIRTGWLSLLHLLPLILLVGVYWVSHHSASSPVRLWISGYLTLAFACLLLCLPTRSFGVKRR